MSEPMLLKQIDGDLMILTINRPEVRNALNDDLRAELVAALDEAQDHPKVRAVILTGGEHFAAGADVKQLNAKDQAELFYWAGSRRVVNRIRSLTKPVIAAVSGFALGAGCEIAMACDLRVAADGAQFGQPEIRLGFIPGAGGTQLLSRLVGAARAKEMVLTGDPVSAEDAYRMGLVNRVVAPEQLMEEAKKLARRCTRNSSTALAAAKLAINTGEKMDIDSAMDYEKLCFLAAFGTEDRKESVGAFFSKRKPILTGR